MIVNPEWLKPEEKPYFHQISLNCIEKLVECIESFNGKFRDELLNCEIFETLFEAKVLIERWRKEYNTLRPHSALGFLPPAPETVDAKQTVSATLQLSV